MHDRAPNGELKSVSTGVHDFFGLIHLILLLFFSWALMHECPLILSGWNNTSDHIHSHDCHFSGPNATSSLIIAVTMNAEVKTIMHKAWNECFLMKHLCDASEWFRGNKLIEFSRILSHAIPQTPLNWEIVLLVFVLYVFIKTPRKGPVIWPFKLNITGYINV